MPWELAAESCNFVAWWFVTSSIDWWYCIDFTVQRIFVGTILNPYLHVYYKHSWCQDGSSLTVSLFYLWVIATTIYPPATLEAIAQVVYLMFLVVVGTSPVAMLFRHICFFSSYRNVDYINSTANGPWPSERKVERSFQIHQGSKCHKIISITNYWLLLVTWPHCCSGFTPDPPCRQRSGTSGHIHSCCEWYMVVLHPYNNLLLYGKPGCFPHCRTHDITDRECRRLVQTDGNQIWHSLGWFHHDILQGKLW